MSLLARNRQSLGHPKLRPNYLHMSVGIGAISIMFFICFTLRCIFNESALIPIALFDFLFVFLLFPLEGPLFRKICLLVAGNCVGLAWYLIQSLFSAASVLYLGTYVFRIITVVIGPIIDLLWVVSIWSLGLSVLASAQRRNEGMKSSNN